MLRAFLEFSAAKHKKNTFKWYKFYFVSIDAIYGTLRPHQVLAAYLYRHAVCTDFLEARVGGCVKRSRADAPCDCFLVVRLRKYA